MELELSKLLEEKCTDDDLVSGERGHREKKQKQVDWDRFLDKLKEGPEILEKKFDRTVHVTKNANRNQNHRTYVIEDTILEKALRRDPPNNVCDQLAEYSPTYKYSRELHNLINEMMINDDEWNEVKRSLFRLCIAKKHDLTDTQIENVFKIRHTWREDTLLMLSSRRDPPLQVVEFMLEQCRESIAIVDTRLHDWIPVIYAITFGAKHEVVDIITPTSEDFKLIPALQEFNFLEETDVYYRTPLHWAISHGASLEKVKAIKDQTAPKALDLKDDLGMRPFELAINEGTSMEIIELLVPSNMDFMTVEKNILRYLINEGVERNSEETTPYSLDSSSFCYHAHDDFAGTKRYDVSVLGSNPKTVPFLAKQISNNSHLQKIMIAKGCETVAIAILMLDFYTCILLTVSFSLSTNHFNKNSANFESTPWLHVLISSILCLGFRELTQSYAGGMRYFLDLWNYFDLATLTVTAWCATKMYQREIDDQFASLAVIGTGLVWFNNLEFLRKTFLPFSIFVNGLITIIWDLIPFLIVSSIVLLAFSQMYHIISLAKGICDEVPLDDESLHFCTSGRAIFSTYAMFVAGIETQDFGSQTPMEIVSMILFGFIVVVILLNVVIAIVSKSWGKVTKKGRQVFWEYRLIYYQDVKNYNGFFPKNKWAQTVNKCIDNVLDRICKVLWTRADYW